MIEARTSGRANFTEDSGRGKWGIREGQLPHVADAMEMFTEFWNALSRNSILRCWKKSQCLSETHITEVTSIINGATDGDEDIIDLTEGRALDFTSADATDDTIVSEELAETIRASLAQHRYLDAPRSPLTEIVDAVSVIDLRTELAAVLNSPAPFDTEESRYELSNHLLDRLSDTYVAENAATALDNIQEDCTNEKIINQCNDAVKNVTDNPVTLSAVTQALSQIQSQSSNE